MFDHKDGVTQAQAANKFKCQQSFITKTLARHTDIQCRKKNKIPMRTEAQKATIRAKCGRLYRKFHNLDWVMDDESYFTLKHSTINGNNNFYSSNVSETPASVKYDPRSKFENKLLVWMCWSNKGVSKPYFVPSGTAINQNIYLKECLIDKCIPFIESFHSDGQYVFWPDLASSHYANSVTNYLRDKKVKFVEKRDNPPNVPECRPIEDFWSILKGEVYKNNWQAKDLKQLRNRITYCLKKIDKKAVQDMIGSTKRRLDNIRRNGLVENK